MNSFYKLIFVAILIFGLLISGANAADNHHNHYKNVDGKHIKENKDKCFSCEKCHCKTWKHGKHKDNRTRHNNGCSNCSGNNSIPIDNNNTEPLPPVSGNETGKTTVTMCKGNTCIYGSNGKMTLTNYASAKDVDYNTLIAFTKSNKIDERSYNANSYNCQFFARDFHDACEASGIKAGWVGSKGMNHAFNVFKTTDRGVIYIDCTGVPGGKSNQDKEITISGNKATGRSLYEGWTFTYEGSVGTLETYW